MRWETISELSPEEFRRLTGVKRHTFEEMIKILEESRRTKQAKGGRPRKLSMEVTLLMALEYLREYRTYFHISKSYGISKLFIILLYKIF